MDTRRALLRKWIENQHSGNVSAFASSASLRQPHIADALAGRRPIGEKWARKIEVAAKMPKGHLEGPASSGDKMMFQGVHVTTAGLLLAIEWEKLDVDERVEFEQQILAAVGRKVREKRAREAREQPKDDA